MSRPITKIATEGRLPERPTLEYDGKRYRRQAGKWLDGYMAVHLTLSQRLDAKAKEDPTFWDGCQEQDREDDPKNRNVVYLEDFTLFSEPIAEDFPSKAVQPVAGYQSSGLGRGPRHRFGLTSQFKKDRALELKCDIEQGWRQTDRTWCFRASDTIPLPGERELRITVAIIEDTRGQSRRQTTADISVSVEASESYSSIESVPPKFLSVERTSRAIRCVLDEHRCMVLIELFDGQGNMNNSLPWEPDSDSSRLSWSEYVFYERPFNLRGTSSCVSRPFRVDLDARIHDRAMPRND